jgi:hypothetical protein
MKIGSISWLKFGANASELKKRKKTTKAFWFWGNWWFMIFEVRPSWSLAVASQIWDDQPSSFLWQGLMQIATWHCFSTCSSQPTHVVFWQHTFLAKLRKHVSQLLRYPFVPWHFWVMRIIILSAPLWAHKYNWVMAKCPYCVSDNRKTWK